MFFLTLPYVLPLYFCDVPVPPNLLYELRKVSPPIPLSADLANTPRLYVLRKSVFYDYDFKYKGVSLQASFSMLIILLFHVVLNFQSTEMILAFNIFSIFNRVLLTYTICYTNLSRYLTNHINQQIYMVLQWFLSLSSH